MWQYAGCVSYMNFVMGLMHSPQSLCNPVVEHWNMDSKGRRYNSSWGLKIFCLSHVQTKKKHLSLFLYQAQNLPSLLFLLGISLQISYLVLHLLYSSLSLTFFCICFLLSLMKRFTFLCQELDYM